MKKLIAILTIAIVLVGAVFADNPVASSANGDASIVVTTTINKAFPAFKLSATSPAGTTDSAVAATNHTAGAVTIDTDALLSNNATVSFAIIQTQTSRAHVKYWIGVTATKLVMTKDENNNSIDTTAADYNASTHEFELVAAVDATPAIVGNNIDNVTVGGTNDGTSADKTGAYFEYEGGKVAANTTIATFDVNWKKNEDAAPGTYQATVTLHVTAN